MRILVMTLTTLRREMRTRISTILTMASKNPRLLLHLLQCHRQHRLSSHYHSYVPCNHASNEHIIDSFHTANT